MPRADFPIITQDELREIADMLDTFKNLSGESVKPDAFKVFDSNGECLGWITEQHGIGWCFAPGADPDNPFETFD